MGNRDATLSLLEHKTSESANRPKVEGAVRHGRREKPRGPWTSVCWKGRPTCPAGPRKVRSWRCTECSGGHGDLQGCQQQSPRPQSSHKSTPPLLTQDGRLQAPGHTGKRSYSGTKGTAPACPTPGAPQHLVHGSEAGGKEEGGAAERNRLRWGPTHPPPLKPFNGSQISGEV